MPYLLDTNVVIRHLNGDPVVQALVQQLTLSGIAMSTVTVREVWQAVYRANNPRELERAYQAFFDSILVIPFDSAIAKRGARLRHDLKQRSIRTRNRAIDLRIATTALYHHLELVTSNRCDDDDMQGLTLYQC